MAVRDLVPPPPPPARPVHLAPTPAPRPEPPAPVLVPDFLHPEPLTRIDVDHTRLAIALAFSSGVSGGLFAEALEKAKVAPSTWEPASFASDLVPVELRPALLQGPHR